MGKVSVRSADEDLLHEMRDPEFAREYLQVAIDESVSEFLIALRKFVRANGGMAACAAKAGVSREALYRMLSADGNPEIRSLEKILRALGIRLQVGQMDDVASAANTPQYALNTR